MTTITIKLKWGKENYDVKLDTQKSALEFKNSIKELTGVPIDRQKLIAKGAWSATLKDDAVLSTMAIKDGHNVMLMGTADTIVSNVVSFIHCSFLFFVLLSLTLSCSFSVSGRDIRRRHDSRRESAQSGKDSCRIAESGEHLLHERHSAMPSSNA